MRNDIEYVQGLEARLAELRTAADLADAEYRAEIERMRLTDAEREAVKEAERCLMWQSAVEAVCEVRDDLPPHESVERAQDAATLRGLLERMGGGE